MSDVIQAYSNQVDIYKRARTSRPGLQFRTTLHNQHVHLNLPFQNRSKRRQCALRPKRERSAAPRQAAQSSLRSDAATGPRAGRSRERGQTDFGPGNRQWYISLLQTEESSLLTKSRYLAPRCTTGGWGRFEHVGGDGYRGQLFSHRKSCRHRVLPPVDD